MQATLAQMSLLDLNKNTPDPKLTASLMRLHVVGKTRLVNNLLDFQSFYGESFMEVAPLKLEVEGKQNLSKHAKDMYNLCFNYQKELIDKIKTVASEKELQNIQENIEIWKAKSEKWNEYADTKNEETYPLQIELLSKSIQLSMKLGEIGSKCIIEMRKDLGVRFSKNEENSYLKRSEESRISGEKKLDEFIDFIKNKVKTDDFPDF